MALDAGRRIGETDAHAIMSAATRSAVSPRTLALLAALVWYAGAVVLVLKGSSLIRGATGLQPGPWPWIAIGAAVLAGALKARFIFIHSCRKNLERIARLDRPRPWQFFRPGFFLALAVMISAGATMSRMAEGHYGPMLGVGALDLSIALALLGGSIPFWRTRLSP